MRLSNLPFKLESELVRAWYRFSGGRPSSAPYLSGDGFRTLADWHYEPATASSFDAQRVAPGSLGFCDGWVLSDFLTKVAPRIRAPFRLISHNADPNVDDSLVGLFPDTLQTLFTMNCLTEDPRVVALPIGLENARFHYNGVLSDFRRLQGRTSKRPRILVAFTVGTNARVRGPALQALSRLAVVDTLSRVNSRAYRKLAVEYAFIASPPGNGEDCHRTWEALYLGSIPIVLRSPLTEAFARRGLPLWQVDSYDELIAYDETALAARYDELSRGLSTPWLWMKPWTELIQGSTE